MLRTTARLILRPPEASDLARLFAIHSDPVTNLFNPAGPMRDLDQANAVLKDWIAHWVENGFGQWAITRRDAMDEVIGFGGIALRQYLDVERLNLGYRFASNAWGKGYATELAGTAMAYGFDELQVHDIFALVRPAHLASIRVLEKTGMQLVDTLDDVPGQLPSLVYKASRCSNESPSGQLKD
ncbi:GNAT family N-acetyltransferase [Pseudomonas violetae]|jgi:RimJ/RimL family protein N-acetyltransferase|uniref:GNAT family N-acetyltransferase n=1 Tax=Pseudomonas violetae TaxID=2915813 RepID=A0ABT0F0S8_9PSED|nr:GNAT family N-acetyltransferase [Pseudomonas violetae]MCK1791321.1 GNAT family N-acetyltransferase [Pseudomonas violetae]